MQRSSMRYLSHRLLYLVQRFRIWKFHLLSDCQQVEGRPCIRQPVQLVGKGRIIFRGKVNLGVYPSPLFFSGYIYIEARNPESVIEIEDGVWINNNCYLISDGPGIYIGKGSMLGTHCEILDSDFHNLHPDGRMTGVAKKGKVVIGENAFIGSNARILKGVQIGNNAVIGNGSVVTRPVSVNSVACGNPAEVVRRLDGVPVPDIPVN